MYMIQLMCIYMTVHMLSKFTIYLFIVYEKQF